MRRDLEIEMRRRIEGMMRIFKNDRNERRLQETHEKRERRKRREKRDKWKGKIGDARKNKKIRNKDQEKKERERKKKNLLIEG